MKRRLIVFGHLTFFLMAPFRDIKFGPIAGANTGGWNVISSSETSSDGKARTEKMLATTEGVTPVDGGKKAFAGKNEELKTERFDGDANNFTYSTGESSNMTLNENIVTGDDNNKRVEKKSSSVTSSSKVVRSSANTGDVVSHDDDFQKHLVHDHDLKSSSTNTEKSSTTTSHSDQQNSSSDYKTTTDNRSENMKLSSDPARVKEAFRLAEQPGKILSRQVERANPTTNMVTERKELTDGTIVTTKRYETISSDHTDIQATTRDNRSSTNNSNVKTHEINKTSQNVETNFKTSRDEEAFRLAQQPGTVISRNVEMADPTTRMITEKKELTDGTIVTTKRYEKVTSSSDQSSNVQSGKNITREHVDKQSTRNITNDAKSTTSTSEDFKKTSTNETFNTSRDEEAFRLSSQPGRVISRDIEMINPTTKMITEKKELNKCGTVVTTKRYETVSDDTQSTKSFTKEQNVDSFAKNLRNNSSNTEEIRKTSQTFKTARDEEAFRLAQQPGTIISREVVNTNPTTRMITEKKELNDGTVVTTKRYESIDDDTQSVKSFTSEQNKSNNLRNDSTSRTEETRKTSQSVNQTFKTARDEEAFRLAQQPGTVISREVVNTNPTTRMITEKKELTDGTIVTTKRYETIGDKNETISKNLNRENVETQNIKRTVTNSNADVNVRRSTFDDQTSDKNVQREVVEETVTKKIYDTSCPCPEKHDSKTEAREFINQERNDNKYDLTSEIIVDVDQRSQTRKQDFTEVEKTREEIIRREQIKKLEQRRVEEQVRRQEQGRKITRELDTDSAHKAFASSLRCVTPPNERVSTPSSYRNDNRSNRSPSRDTTSSKISSSTTTIRKSSNYDVSKNERRSSTKSSSPEKSPKKVTPDSRRSTTEFVETVEIDTKHRSVSPQKGTTLSPSKPDTSNKNTPRKVSPDSRDVSPQKSTPRDGSPTKHYPSSNVSMPRGTSPQKETSPSVSSREPSPTKHYPSSNVSTPRGTSPQKYPSSGSSTPRGTSPQKYPTSKPTSRDVSPNKTSSTKTTRRDDAHDEIFSSTIVIDNKEKRFKDDIKIVQNIDTRDMSATTSVSDLEYIIPSDHRLLTDLDNDLQIRVDLSNFNQTDDLKVKTTITEINGEGKKPSKKPDDKKPFNRSETFEERARKLIGVTPEGTPDDELPHYAKPTYASFPSGSTSRVSEIRERKAKIEKETQDIEKVSISKRKSVTSETEDFITREKTEDRRSTRVYSSPDSSPTRTNSKPASKKPTEPKKPHDRSIDKEEITRTNPTKTTKTTEPRQASPEKKKPSTFDSSKTSNKITSEHTTTTKRVTSDREPVRTRSPIRQKSPETHITVAKINISPVRGTTSKVTKTTSVETSKNIKVSPSIRLVKRPLTDVSSTEPDSEIETDQELIKNIDKATSKTTRKKLIQSRKDSAPVHKTTVTSNKEKVSRSVSENIFKTDISTSIKKKTSKDVIQPKESSPKKDTKRPTKHVTTKTINVNAINSNTLDDVLIDVQQAKSSREPSPDKIVPTPVRPDEDLNGHQLIYPNKVTEPEDHVRHQKPKVKNIPIFEEKTKQFVGLEITEVETDKSQIILEEDEIDEHESSVINSSTLERCDRKRNSVQIDPLDDEDGDQDYLLSVSQKVNKFISTAEELKKPKTSVPFNTDDVKLEDVSEPEDDSMLTVNRKVTKFSTTTDDTLKYDKRTKQTVEDSMTRSFDEVDENLRNDECLLSVSDKVNKFISSADKLKSSTPQKSPELVKNFMKSTTTSRAGQNVQDVNEKFLFKEKISTLTREDRDRSESKTMTKSSTSDITLKSTEAIKKARAVFENNTSTRDTKRHEDILSRPSVWEGKRTPTSERKVYKETVTTKTSRVEEKSPSRRRQSPTRDGKSRSRESESPSRERYSPVKDYGSPARGINSPSRETKSPSRERHSPVKDYGSPARGINSPSREAKSPSRERHSPVKDYATSSPSPTSPRRGSSDKTPVYMRDQVSTKKDLFEKRISSSKLESEMNQRNSVSPQNSYTERNRSESEEVHHNNVTRRTSSDKHYMSHTVASLEHVSNERKESEMQRTSRRDSGSRQTSGTSSPTKYHRNISESTNDSNFDAPRTPTKFGVELKRTDSGRHVQRTSSNAETINIEDIFDLEELEKLLEVVVGYEQRRRIRAQIRIVRRIMSEKQTSSENYVIKTTSETKTNSERKTSTERKASTERKNCVDTRTVRSDKITTSSSNYTSPTRKSRDDSSVQTKVTQKFATEKPEKDSRAQRIVTTTTTTIKQSSDKPREVTQTKTTRVVNDNKTSPRGIIENLNKSSKAKMTENVVKTVKKTSATSNAQKTSSTRDSRTDTDYLSYGVGPTDSNGLPLFGLKALKKNAPKTSTTKESKSKFEKIQKRFLFHLINVIFSNWIHRK